MRRSPLVASRPRRKLSPLARLIAFASVPVLLIAVGAAGYRAIEGWSWFDAIFKCVFTLTSLGHEIHPPSFAGRLFTMALALGGVFTFALTMTEVLRTFITGDLRDYLEIRRMQKRIDALEQHVIVCGYGRVGRHTCARLRDAGIPTVVIDQQDGPLAAARDAGAHPVSGDATVDSTLRQAGIARARALVAAAGNDPENVLITMTAHLLQPALPIVARALDESSIPKLLRAGAASTISPYAIVGRHMAQAVLRPELADVIAVATRNDLADLQIEEHLVRPGSPLDGETVGASGLRTRMGVILLAIKRLDGEMAFNPRDDAALTAGDTLIFLGHHAQVQAADEPALAQLFLRTAPRP